MNNGKLQFTSLTDGTLSPDSRVNYEFGLVLGVNEFRQEQKYFLEKHYLHNSELHGYGTISGLRVSADKYPADKPTDVQVTVKPGMAIDQLGRPLVVRTDQCARLGAWLAQQVKDDADTFKKHPPDEEGCLTVYVVASYAEMGEKPVPIAGGLATSSTSADSRIRDSFDIEFRWNPPLMPAWAAVRDFAALLERLHVTAGIPDEDNDNEADHNDDEIEDIIEDICEKVRSIGKPARKYDHGKKHKRYHSELSDADRVWYFTEDVMQYVLERIFIVWTTEVRPCLAPNLIEEQSRLDDQEVGILLASITFQPDNPFLVNKPVIVDFCKPDDLGRPLLLSTQVLQELISTGGRDAQPPREFATLQTLNNHTLQVWVHHPIPLFFSQDIDDWNEVLELRSDGQPLTISDLTPLSLPDMPNVFTLSIKPEESDPSTMMLPGARVELTFKLEKFLIREVEEKEEETRREKPDDSGLVAGVEDVTEGIEKGVKDALEGKIIKGTERVVEGALHGTEDIVEGAFKGVKDVGEGLVEGVEDVAEGLEKGEKALLKGKVGKSAEDVVAGTAEGVVDIVKGGVEGINDVLGLPDEENDENANKEHKHTLYDSINDLDIDYVGYDRVSDTITVYTIADHWPTHELVTLYLYNPQVASIRAEHPGSALAEAVGAETSLHLWFHTATPVKLPESCQVRVPRSFTEPPEGITFTASAPPGISYSYFWALVSPPNLSLQPGELLTVELDTNQILVKSSSSGYDNGEESDDITIDRRNKANSSNTDKDGDDKGDDNLTLTEFLKSLPFRFASYDGDHTIIAHHQVPLMTQTLMENGAREEKREERRLRPRIPFVTITHLPNQQEKSATSEMFELWFHLVPDPGEDIASFNESLSCEVYAELSDLRRSGRAEVTNVSASQLNVFTVSVTLPQPTTNQQVYYLCFKFPLAANPVSKRKGSFFQNLGEYIENRGIDFEGFNGRDAIVAYIRIPIRRTAYA